LTETNKQQYKWLRHESVPDDKYNKFINSYKKEDKSCNTLKATACEVKCKTRGILLGVANCGIIMSFRELFGTESLTQVTTLYLDTLDLYMGNNLNLKIFQ